MGHFMQQALRLPLWFTGIALVLSSGAIALLMNSTSDAKGIALRDDATYEAAAAVVAAPRLRASWCADCAVIESTQQIQGHGVQAKIGDVDVAGNSSAMKFSTTLRLQDGSMLVVNDTNPERWRRGERVKLIAGLK